MNQFAVLLSFLAAPADLQADALPSLPLDPGARDFFSGFETNPLYVLVHAFLEYSQFEHNEPWEVFTRRLGIDDASIEWPASIQELTYVLTTLRRELDHSLWTVKGLRNKPEWRLVRRVATAVLDDFGWRASIDAGDVSKLLNVYTPLLKRDSREGGSRA